MVCGLRAQSPKYDWDQGSELRIMGSGITRRLSPNQGSDLLHGLKISYHNIFPHNKVCVHRISCPRYITHSCFRLMAVPVIRSPGCLTKLWYEHIRKLRWRHRATFIHCKGRRSTKKIFAQGKTKWKKIHAHQLILKKYSCYGLKKILTSSLITKKNSCGSKIPLPPPHNFSKGPSLTKSHNGTDARNSDVSLTRAPHWLGGASV